MSAATPAGWYPDPHGEAELRYWDGNDWTEHTHSAQAQGAPPQQAPPPAQAPPQQAPPPQQEPAYTPGGGSPYASAPARGGPGGRNTLPFIIGGVVAVAIVAVIVVLLLGGGGGGDDTADIESAAETALTSRDGSEVCETTVSEDFLNYSTGQTGSQAQSACSTSISAAPFATGADISDASADGDEGEARAQLTGGNFNGKTANVELTKDGDDWKVDGITVDGQRVTILGGPDPTQAKQDAEEVVVDFGGSVGASACDYFSENKLDEYGGRSGCEAGFGSAVAAQYDVQDSSVTGNKAKVTVTTQEDNTIDFDLVYENGEWKIDDFNKRS